MAVDEQILARDLVAMSDEELDNYLHAKRGRGAKGVGLVETSAMFVPSSTLCWVHLFLLTF